MSSSMVDSIFGFGREDADVCYYEILGCDELSTVCYCLLFSVMRRQFISSIENFVISRMNR